jgi:phage-related holin
MIKSLTLYPAKILAGIFAGFLSLFVQNLLPLFITVTVFELVDFATGVIKSAVVANRTGQRFAFESIKAWRTIYKYVFILIGIVLAELLDQTVANETRLRFANYFTAFCCGVEFWSFLENAAVISDHPVFRWLRKYMRFKLEDQIGMSFEEAKKDDNK